MAAVDRQNEKAPAEHEGRMNETLRSVPHGVWRVENLRAGENWSVVAGSTQVAVCARRDVAEAICDAMNAAIVQAGHAKILDFVDQALFKRDRR